MIAEHAVTVIRLNSGESDMNFVEGVQKLYPNQKIKVTVETGETDETDFLLSSPKNRERLLPAIATEDLLKGRTFTSQELEEYVKNGP